VTVAGLAGQRPYGRAALVVTGLAVAGLAFGTMVLVLSASGRHATSTSTWFSGTVGGLYLVTGVLAHAQAPDNRVGLLMVLVGIGWFAEDVQVSIHPVVHTVGLLLRSVASGFLVHLVLAFPNGTLRSTVDRAIVVAGYLTVLVITPLTVPLMNTQTPNLWLVTDATEQLRVGFGIGQVVIAVAVVLVLAHRWVVASRPARRVLLPVYATGLTGAITSVVHPLINDRPVQFVLEGIEHAATLALPVAFLAGVWRVRLGRTAIGDLLLRLPGSSPTQLRTLLARALGDPSLRVGYYRPAHDDYVDHDGLPLLQGRQHLTVVERAGRRVAALIHDPAIREDRHVLAAVTAAAALELDNQRLAAEVRAQLVEVRASRARIVAAGDEQRRRVERDLHDGAQQQLVTVALTLRLAQQQVGDSDPKLTELLGRGVSGLEDALAELRELARGIHPAVLTEAGLLPALNALAGRSPIPVELRDSPVPELTPPVQATAYYVAAEAVTNALKHARATRIRIEVHHDPDGLHVIVTDDGIGGADMSAGTGLLGLRDRVSAVDGELIVYSPPGAGTTLHAVLPVVAP
jgi:signal transduction histidine kinase